VGFAKTFDASFDSLMGLVQFCSHCSIVTSLISYFSFVSPVGEAHGVLATFVSQRVLVDNTGLEFSGIRDHSFFCVTWYSTPRPPPAVSCFISS
jgi:hypothetical protein